MIWPNACWQLVHCLLVLKFFTVISRCVSLVCLFRVLYIYYCDVDSCNSCTIFRIFIPTSLLSRQSKHNCLILMIRFIFSIYLILWQLDAAWTALQNMHGFNGKFKNFFLCLWLIFRVLVINADAGVNFGSFCLMYAHWLICFSSLSCA